MTYFEDPTNKFENNEEQPRSSTEGTPSGTSEAESETASSSEKTTDSVPERAPLPSAEWEPRSAPNTPPVKPKKKKKEYRLTGAGVAILVVLCISLSILAGGVVGFLNYASHVHEEYPTPPTGVTPAETTGGVPTETKPVETVPTFTFPENSEVPQTALTKVANEVLPSVVVIQTTETVSSSYGYEQDVTVAGTGVIYTKDGYIVTNYHVAGEASKSIMVRLSDGSMFDGRFIFGDETNDISVIKIEKNDCHPATFGDSDKMIFATPVFAIGNALGKGLHITDGIITAPESTFTVDNIAVRVMNTNAAVNNGNSGGGLFNLNGELVGIVNGKTGGSTVEGFGYAIPSSVVMKVINDLNEYGYVTGKARLGVSVKPLRLTSWTMFQTYSYVQISEVQAGGTAELAGLKAGDILLRINDTAVSTTADLDRVLTMYKVGDTVTLTVRRPTIEPTNSNLSEYINSAEEVKLTATFVEFKPAD